MLWYIALNTFTPGASVAPGTVISSHRTYQAADWACRLAQLKERNSYLPTRVVVTRQRFNRGTILAPHNIDRLSTERAQRDWQDGREVV